jgi:hypothetical protein
LDEEKIKDALEFGMDDVVLMLEGKVKDITPRDPERLPMNPDAPVTGNLKRSITTNKESKYKHIIGTLQNAANYGYWLEFGSRYMAPRSFLRLALIENEEEA